MNHIGHLNLEDLNMVKQPDVYEKQFDKTFKIPNIFLLLSGIKISRDPYNKYVDHFVNYQLFYYDAIILHTVIIGEIYGVIDCIQTGKSLVELSFNLPCITISILATTKIAFLYKNRDALVDFFYKLKQMHCNFQKENYLSQDELAIMQSSIKMINLVLILMPSISCIVQIMFCLVPVLLMTYDYIKTGELVIIYPFLVKYNFYDIYESSWWPLIYFHQTLATAVTCLNSFGCDILFIVLCSYIEMHFRLLGLHFEKAVLSTNNIQKNLAKAVRRHQELIDLVNQMEFVYSKSILFHMVAASLLICLSAFIITITEQMNVIIAFITFLLMSLSQISLLCYFADILMHSSIQVSKSVYKSSWYEVDRDAKKILFVIMIRSQKACKLTAWKFVDLNLRAFTRILSTSWSYFAVLRTMYE